MLQLRRYQRGSVFKRGRKNKVWYGMWREDVRKAVGSLERRQRHVKLGTVAEIATLSAAREEMSRRMGQTQKPKVEMQFSELCERWKMTIAPTLKGTTAGHYQNALRAYIMPTLGTMEVSSVGRYDVESFLAEQSVRYSRSTLRSMRGTLRFVLSWAVNCGWIEKNPCSGVKLPRGNGRRVTRTVLTAEQVVHLAGRLQEPLATLVLFLAVTGLRIGEAIAIKWADFEGDVLHVSRRIYNGKVDTTKTEGSDRQLPMPLALLDRMRALGGREWVFCGRGGSPVNPGNARRRYLRPAAEALGITIGGWHDFRHTATTQLLRSGVSPKIVSEIMGHSDVKITLDIYDHPETESFRAPLAGAEQLLHDVTKSASLGAG